MTVKTKAEYAQLIKETLANLEEIQRVISTTDSVEVPKIDCITRYLSFPMSQVLQGLRKVYDVLVASINIEDMTDADKCAFSRFISDQLRSDTLHKMPDNGIWGGVNLLCDNIYAASMGYFNDVQTTGAFDPQRYIAHMVPLIESVCVDHLKESIKYNAFDYMARFTQCITELLHSDVYLITLMNEAKCRLHSDCKDNLRLAGCLFTSQSC